MNITLQEAARIIDLTEDEMMFEHQSGNIQAGVNQDTLAWEFVLEDVLNLKEKKEAEQEASDQEFTGD